MDREVTLSFVRLVMIGLGVISVLVAWSWTNDEPPSFYIAMWVWPHELSAGEPFVVNEIFVRNRRCARFASHRFVQGGAEVKIYPDPEYNLWPDELGLRKQKFDGIVPFGLSAGPARYWLTIDWVCFLNPISYFQPYEIKVYYDVLIEVEAP